MDYEHPIALSDEVLKRRIFSPLAYPVVRNANVIRIAHSEAARYAAHFPVVWRKIGNGAELVVVRSLLADGRGHAPGSQQALPFLPTLCRAYPFLLNPQIAPAVDTPRLFDDAIADEAKDVGAPVCTPDGRPTKATVQRLGLLDAFVPPFQLTQALCNDLIGADLFEPWALSFDNIEGHKLEVTDLLIIRQTSFATGAFAPVLRTYGLPAAELLALHRISLFRAGILLANARKALVAAKAAVTETVAEAAS